MLRSLPRASWFGLAPVSLVTVVAACVGDDPASTPSAGGSSSSSSGQAQSSSSGETASSSGAANDATAPPGGTFCERTRTPDTLYCADFDGADTDAGSFGTVHVVGAEARVTTSYVSTTFGRSLDVSTGTDPGQSTAWLEHTLPNATSSARIEFDMYIDAVAVDTGRDGSNGFLPLFANGSHLFAIGVRDGGRGSSSGLGGGGPAEGRELINPYVVFNRDDIVDMGSKEWVHVTQVLTLTDRLLQVARGGNVVRTETAAPIRLQSLAVGIQRGGDPVSPGAAWRVLYDNIVVTEIR